MRIVRLVLALQGVLGLVLLVAGVCLRFGLVWALITAGAALLVGSYVDEASR